MTDLQGLRVSATGDVRLEVMYSDMVGQSVSSVEEYSSKS